MALTAKWPGKNHKEVYKKGNSFWFRKFSKEMIKNIFSDYHAVVTTLIFNTLFCEILHQFSLYFLCCVCVCTKITDHCIKNTKKYTIRSDSNPGLVKTPIVTIIPWMSHFKRSSTATKPLVEFNNLHDASAYAYYSPVLLPSGIPVKECWIIVLITDKAELIKL